jgi:Regulator of ribonuclease activity B
MGVRPLGQSADMAADEESEFEVLAEGETPDEHDVEILEALEEHGADLSEPYEVRVNLSFPSEAEAEAATTELEDAGYDVVAFEAAGEEEPWAIRATRELSIGRDNVAGFRSRFADLAERHGGEFDSWEAAAD